MAIQQVLDKSKPYGTVIGGGGAMFTQRGVLFNIQGVRVSELTVEEVKAEAADKAASIAHQKALEADAVAVIAVETADQQKKNETAEEFTSAKPNMPDVANWTKADMINHARNVKGVEISPHKTWIAVKDQLESLY